jgi:choline-sulfatase
MRSEKSKPNVIICMTDQFRAFDTGCYGNKTIRTPNIDTLASEGIRFETALSNNPVCTPARACLLSGQYSRTCQGYLRNTGVESPALERRIFPEKTLPESFSEEGYRTALIGKWHLEAHPKTLGFDKTVYPKVHHRNRNQTYHDGTGKSYIVKDLAEEYNIRQLDEFLGERNNDREPFFIYYNIATPHMPYFDVPEEYKTMYRNKDMELRGNVSIDGKLPYDERYMSIYLWDYLYYMGDFDAGSFKPRVNLPNGFDIRDLTALYYGMISFTDYYVGRMMETLKDHGMDDETLVVFTSDHGDNLGSHHLFGKNTVNEESIRVPMIYRMPGGFKEGEKNTCLTQLIDVMPTLLDFCGISIPEGVQGESVLPHLKGNTGENDREKVYIETAKGEIAVRTNTHLYSIMLDSETRTVSRDPCRYYDLLNDPLELSNLAENNDLTEDSAAENLRQSLLQWNEETPWL